MDRRLFLFGVVIVCCLAYPPFLGLWIGIALFYGLALLAYIVMGGILR